MRLHPHRHGIEGGAADAHLVVRNFSSIDLEYQLFGTPAGGAKVPSEALPGSRVFPPHYYEPGNDEFEWVEQGVDASTRTGDDALYWHYSR